MRKKLLALSLAIVGAAIVCNAAWALIAAPPPGPVRIVNSDAVFVGRVTAIEPQDVDAKQFPGAKQTVKYRIAVVTISQTIRGLKDEKTIRVGFVPPVPPKPGVPITGGGNRSPQLQAGQDGLFMITKHAEGKFYQAPGFGYFVAAQDKNFADEVKLAKKVVVILADPLTALKSKDSEERLLAASIQIGKHRTQKPPFNNKQEPIDADESKLILDALLASKWQPGRFGDPANAYQIFAQIGIGPQDGWKSPAKVKDIDEIRQSVLAWLRDHPGYRIKRFLTQGEKQ